MKILIIMHGFFPGNEYGGPPVSVDNFCTLMNEDECYIVTHNHDMKNKTPYENVSEGWNDRTNCKVKYLQDKEYNQDTFEQIIKKVKPDILYLQGLFQPCIIPCLKLAKKYAIRVLLAPRGELCKGAFKKKYKKIPYIVYLRIMKLFATVSFQSTSFEETATIKKYLGVQDERIYSLTNIPSIPKSDYGLKSKETDTAAFIFLSRIVRKKNLHFALNALKNVSGNVMFDIYGTIEDENYWSECQGIIDSLPSNITVNYKGNANHESVHEIFSKYDAMVFPTQSENFGHVIAEAMFAGCPVIISDQTPWNDLQDSNAGWDMPLQESDFVNKMQIVIDMDEKSMSKMRQDTKLYVKNRFCLDELRTTYKKSLVAIARLK